MIDVVVSDAAQVVVRALSLTGILLVIGAVVGDWRMAPLFEDASVRAVRRRIAVVRNIALLAVAIALVVRLVQQSAAFADEPHLWSSMVPLVLTQTIWGLGWCVQLAGVLIVLFAARMRPGADGRIPILALVGAIALAKSPALQGHAVGASTLATLAVVCDALHVAGGGAWLGTLAVLVLAIQPVSLRAPSGTLAAVLARFSPIALSGAVVAAATGLFASWLHVDTPTSLWTSTYGRTLLLKVTIVGCVAAVGAYNWRVVTPRLRASGDTAALQRFARIELVLAAALVAVTALLVSTPLPGEM